ncbi:MAG: M24 family metallopeptidase [Thermomicrobiales bacterium]
MVMNKADEFAIKLDRLHRLLDAHELAGLVLASEANCAWLSCGPDDGAELAGVTGGRTRIWQETERGVAALIVTRDTVYLHGENIEFPRLARNEFTGLPFVPLAQDWRRSDLAAAVAEVCGAGAAVGYDLYDPALVALPGARYLGPAITDLRASLTQRELVRYRWLCAQAAHIAREVCLALAPGWREAAIVAAAEQRLLTLGIANAVPIVTCDGRMWVDRHGLYGDARLERYAMIVFCARKWGLTACLTRLVHFGPLPDELRAKSAATRRIARRLHEATRPGTPLATIFTETLLPAYATEGYPDEPAHHHQGGSTGYAGRDTRVTDQSAGAVMPDQAFAWNPSIAGTKTEETILARTDGYDILTHDPNWPLDDETGLPVILER